MHVEISWVLALKYIESLKPWSLYIKKHRYAKHLRARQITHRVTSVYPTCTQRGFPV